MKLSPGKRFRNAVIEEHPLQIPGVINAYVALMAEQIGYSVLYLSGAGIANSSYGLPDLAMTTLENVLEDARRITAVTDLPLLVDIDTGFGNHLMIQRTIREMIRAGVAGVHIEDQVFNKRCGHRDGKKLVSTSEMTERIQAAAEAKTEPDFVIMARTDALAVEGLDAALERSKAYRLAGADMLFPEAITEVSQYQKFKDASSLPILANMTEFGKTPLLHLDELANAGVDMALYPLSANRAMNKAAYDLLQDLRFNGTQAKSVDKMQTRDELYKILQYEKFEKIFNEEGKK